MPKECELVERAIMELDAHYTDDGFECSEEDRAFIRVTAMTIEKCLERKCKKEDLVARYSENVAGFKELF